MLFAAFGLQSLMVLVIWATDPVRLCDDRYHSCAVSAFAPIGGILRKARVHATAKATRHELANDGKIWRTIVVSSKGERENAVSVNVIQQQRLDPPVVATGWRPPARTIAAGMVLPSRPGAGGR